MLKKNFKIRTSNFTKQIIGWLFYGATALFIFIVLYRSWDQIRNFDWQFNFWYLFFALLLGMFYFISWGLCWYIILFSVGIKKNFIDLILIYAKSQLFRYIPGNLWSFLARVNYYKKLNIPSEKTLYGTILEAVFILLSGTLISLLVVLNKNFNLIFRQNDWIWIIIVSLIILSSPFIIKKIFARTKGALKPNLKINLRSTLIILIFYFASWIIFGTSLFFIIKSVTAISWNSFWWIIGVNAISWIIGYLTLITPSGIGAREAVMTLTLKSLLLLGISTTIVFLSRIMIVISEIMVFGIIVILAQIQKKEKSSNLVTHYQKLTKTRSDFRWDAIKKLILPHLKKGEVLDLGCGPADISLFLAKNGFKTTACDPDIEMLKIAKKRVKNANIKLLQIGTDNLSQLRKKFDNILFLDVLEHIRNDKKALKQISSKLTSQGRLILLIPALQLLYGNRDKQIGHWRRYDKPEIKKKLLEAGFKIKKIRYWNFIGFFPYFIYEKIFRKRIGEKFRYKNTISSFFLKKILGIWFKIENKIRPPIGLSLFVIAERQK